MPMDVVRHMIKILHPIDLQGQGHCTSFGWTRLGYLL